MASSTSAAQTITTQANSLINLINWQQGIQEEQELRMMAEAAGMDLPSLPGDGGGSGDGGDGGSGSGYSGGIQIDTNGLWLGNPVVSNGITYVNLNNATNLAYAILTKTNLLDANWTIEQVILPTNGTVIPTVTLIAVQNSGRQILFFRAEDWTGVTENGNTTPDWWLWKYFGTTALSETSIDCQGNTLVYDYTNHLIPYIAGDVRLGYWNFDNTNTWAGDAGQLPLLATNFASVPSWATNAVMIDSTNAVILGYLMAEHFPDLSKHASLVI